MLSGIGYENCCFDISIYMYAKMIQSSHRALPIPKAVEYINEQLQDLVATHQSRVNRDRNFQPVLLDMDGFADIADLLTHYCLEKAMPKWAAAKRIVFEEEQAGLQNSEVNLDDDVCKLACELPLRYGIPCRYWIVAAMLATNLPLPPAVAT
jgi:hypothetical protein